MIPEGVFNNGKTVYLGYFHLYKKIRININLIIENVICYSKGVFYQLGFKFKNTNHEYNVNKLNNLIDSTLGTYWR